MSPQGKLEPVTYKCQECHAFHTKENDCSRPSEIVKKIQYKNWQLYVPDDQSYLQVSFMAKDVSFNGYNAELIQRGRKWQLSPHMTRSEVVQTAMKAVLAAEEHETREQFLYKGQAIFGPHFNVEALVKLAEQEQLDSRQPA